MNIAMLTLALIALVGCFQIEVTNTGSSDPCELPPEITEPLADLIGECEAEQDEATAEGEDQP